MFSTTFWCVFFALLKSVSSDIEYSSPPFTQLSIIYQLYQSGDFGEGEKLALDLLVKVQGGDSKVNDRNKPWQRELQHNLRMGVTALWMSHHYASSMGSDRKNNEDLDAYSFGKGVKMLPLRGVDPGTYSLTREFIYKRDEVSRLLSVPLSQVDSLQDVDRNIRYGTKYTTRHDDREAVTHSASSKHTSLDGWRVTAARPIAFDSKEPPSWLDTGVLLPSRGKTHDGGRRGEDGEFLVDVVIIAISEPPSLVRLAHDFLRRHCARLGDIYVISSQQSDAPSGSIWVPEGSFPLRRSELHDSVYRQLLKLLFFRTVPRSRRHAMMMDGNVLFLQDVEFLTAEGQGIHTRGDGMTSWDATRTFANGGPGYVDFVEALLGFSRSDVTMGDPSQHASVHHMVCDRDTVEELFSFVDERVRQSYNISSGRESPVIGGDPHSVPDEGWEPWMTFVHVYAAHHTPMSTVLAHDPGLEGLTVHQIHETSEYELYDAFASSSRVSVESYHVRSLNSTSLSFCFQYVNYIDKFKDEMHDDLSTTFGLDFVVCEPWME